jgi:RNA polymerase primary sigma factor
MIMNAQPASRFSSPSESRTIRVSPGGQSAALGSRLRYVDHPSFDDPAARTAILAPVADPAGEEISPRLRLVPLPNGEARPPMLSREQEAHLFRKMNYLKCRADRLIDQLNEESPSRVTIAEIERLQSEAQAVKNRIVEMNLPLVIFVVKKRIRAGQELTELVSEGNLALIQAVDRFDFARGNRFSTYATWAIRNALVSKAVSDRRHRGRSFAHYEASLLAADPGVAEFENEAVQDQRRSIVRRWFACLGKRERWVLTNRYGLSGAAERTLAQLGRELGISKQRVSQIAARAEGKLRKIARRETLEALEI